MRSFIYYKRKVDELLQSLLLAILLLIVNNCQAQNSRLSLSFDISVPQAAAHLYHVVFRCGGITNDSIELKLPAWTPGYYQLLDFADNISDFNVTDSSGNNLLWRKSSRNGWMVNANHQPLIVVTYDVRATRSFVATNYLDENRGYLSSPGVFLHPADLIKNPVSVTIEPLPAWNIIATGLDTIEGKPHHFMADDYDVLYDSPFLMGRLESFPSFFINGVPPYFVAYQPGDFDKKGFMEDMKKIVTTASSIIGDIPYRHYTFLGIGAGGGGIEHLNSASVAFNGTGLKTNAGKVRMYNFLAHEYFHHYNVKRIRPIELGPFDYDNGSVTKMLWLSEGVTVYYEYMIIRRAGFTTPDELLRTFQAAIKEYETKPGRFFQTSAEASADTWADGPFGRTGDDLNKTISPYDKGPALGILLDFKIRHETKNKKSLDMLMRQLYQKYYQQLNRGFTEDEFRKEAELMAGVSLKDFFDYIYTLKQIDYPGYFKYAGLIIDTVAKIMPGPWIGTSVKQKNDTLYITNTEWQSPGWNAGLRNRMAIVSINGAKADSLLYNHVINTAAPADTITFQYLIAGKMMRAVVVAGTKKESSYAISKLEHPDKLQRLIFESWMGGKR